MVNERVAATTPSPLRHYSPQFSWILLPSTTRVPTGARDVLGHLADRGAQLALGADRIAALTCAIVGSAAGSELDCIGNSFYVREHAFSQSWRRAYSGVSGLR